LINQRQSKGELKVITKRIYANQELVTTQINFLEGYVIRAKGLTLATGDFGFMAVRAANRKGDIEALVSNLSILTNNTGKAINMAALTIEGWTAAKQTALVGLNSQLGNDNKAQNDKINEGITLVSDNHAAINGFWLKVTDLCDAGKRIFKPISADKLQQYVVTTLIGRVRNEVKKNSVTGMVEPKARIEFKPLTGGRNRVVYANAKGAYSLVGGAPGEYHAIKSVKGKPAVSKNVVIETNENVVENFV